MSKTLQEITDIWGSWWSTQHGTTCRFTASTNYSSQSFLGDYHRYEIKVTSLGGTYDPNAEPMNAPDVTYATQYTNKTDVDQEVDFERSLSTEQTLSWSVTETVSLGVSMTATIGAPEVASVSATVSIDFSVASTQAHSESKTQEWKVSQKVIIPKRSLVKATDIVKQQQYYVNYTEKSKLQGYVAVWNNDKVDLGHGKHWLYFFPIREVIANCSGNNLADVSASVRYPMA